MSTQETGFEGRGPSIQQAQDARLPAGSVTLHGDLVLPRGARGLVIFAHGSGSSRHSPRNRAVARVLQQARLGTLLVDLLTPEEEAVDLRTQHLRFDVELLADRVVAAIDHVRRDVQLRHQPIGLFGASTGAAAALLAAAGRPGDTGAVVSRGGRPDLAGSRLTEVRAPTLLLVGSEDRAVIPLNTWARDHLRCEVELQLIPGATHLFEEHGALQEVARQAALWFARHLDPSHEKEQP